MLLSYMSTQKEEVIAVLKEEDVISSKVFKCLKEDHILRLLKNEVISVGQYSLIWQLWEVSELTQGNSSSTQIPAVLAVIVLF